MSEKSRNILGITAITLLSVIILTIFYGNLFDKLNQVSFANGGDGLQSYINMEYHIRYDTSYMRCNSMNYPYGEHVFFTNNQPLFSNTVKFVSENITDISEYTLGMLNLLMLLSLVITPIILYLVFRHFKTGRILSVFASMGITFLTPQLDRFGGHYNLSYVCAIPLIILLLLKFFEKPSVFLSFLLFLTMMAGALTHFYLYGFFALLMLFFYGSDFIHKKTFANRRTAAIHLFVQLILPFLILQAFYISDHVTDRPGYPWGFLYYRAYPQSVFLPLNKPYGQFLHSFINTGYIDWEGYSIIGTLAFFGFLYFIFRFTQKLFKRDYASLWQVTDNRYLNIMFWASVAGLLYSFGLPFILGLERLIDMIGPLRQMRGIARFAWVFYYVMNIVTIYWLWTWWQKERKLWLKMAVIAAALLLLNTDAWYNVRGRGKWLENRIPAMTDSALKLPENQWIRRVNTEKYQAFIPLPYFHIGSENIWIDGGCDIVSQSFVTIRNSGLPCMGVMLSRTSIGQTIENISLMLGPACNELKMERFPSEKPFLLMAARCELLSEREKQLIQHAIKIDSSAQFDIYDLPFNAFREIADSSTAQVFSEFDTLRLYEYNGIFSTVQIPSWRFLNYDSLNNGQTMFGTGFYSGIAKSKNELFNGLLPHVDTSQVYVVSFWMNRVSGDLYPRTTVRLNEYEQDGKLAGSVPHPVSKKFVMIDANRVLVEIEFRIKNPGNRLVIILDNKALRKKPLEIDDLLIRPQSAIVYQHLANGVWKNNRHFVPCR